jgi:hypothetical protein
VTRGEEFEELRPLLFAIAYRILGSVAEAEDAIQETWLRDESSPAQATSTDRRERAELAARFLDALRDGDIDGLRELLAADVQMVGDGGGKAPALARSIIGAHNVARVFGSICPALARTGVRVESRALNGEPGAILRDRDGRVAGTFTLDVLGGQIQTIRLVVNPDKLGHVGPVADAWAIAREVKRARRHRDWTDPATRSQSAATTR